MNNVPHKKSVMLVAGEISGDINGAHLIRAIKEENKHYSLSFFGLGGEKMEKEGLKNIYNLTDKGTIGFFEVLKYFPHIFYAYRKASKLLKKEKPDLLVLIDYQGFNVTLARKAKKNKTRVVYYIPPQEWIWGSEKGGKNVAENVDRLITIFEREDEFYRKVGAKTTYVGHPILDILDDQEKGQAPFLGAAPKGGSPLVGLFPGSRHQEINLLLPVILEVAKKIQERNKNIRFILSLSSSVFEKKVTEMVSKSGVSIKIIKGKSKEVISSSKMIITASGTVTLEAAVLERPMIVLYKISKISYFLANNILKIKVPFASLPNILLNKMAVPEFLQDNVESNDIAEETMQILNNEQLYNNIKNDLVRAKGMLGEKGAIKRAASVVLEEIDKC